MEVTSYLLGKKSGGGGSEPTGTIDITSNGTKNVKSYATANVNVQPNLQNKSITVNTNGSTNVSADNNYDGLDTVSITTNVQPNLETKSVTITENGTTSVTPTSGKDGLSSVSITTNVSGGGGDEPVHTLGQLNEKANGFIDYLMSVPDTYPSYTDEQVTLYTPNENYKTYVVGKKANVKEYRIYWIRNNNAIKCENKSSIRTFSLFLNGTTNDDLTLYNDNITLNPVGAPAYRSNWTFTSVESCIEAMKDSSTYYTYMSSETNYPLEKDTPYEMPLCNTFVYSQDLDSLWTSRKVSSNETIEVIQ